MKAYAGFKKDMTYNGYQYEEGKEYTQEGEIKCGHNGFPAYEYPLDVFCNYAPGVSVFHEVELSGDIDKSNEDSEVTARTIKIGAEIDIAGLVEAAIEYTTSRCGRPQQKHSSFFFQGRRCRDNHNDTDKKQVTNSGEYGMAANSGNCGAATNNGYCGVATNSGDRGAAANSGNYGAATNSGIHGVATNIGKYGAATNSGEYGAVANSGDCGTATNNGYCGAATNSGSGGAAANSGDYGAATNSGYFGAATNSGNFGAATNSGDYGAATSSGYRSAATNSGIHGAATNSGDFGTATNSGDYGVAITTGSDSEAVVLAEHGLAVAFGVKSKARGILGSWIVCVEYEGDSEDKHSLVCVKAARVDGEAIKADTYYTLKNGEFVEVQR